MYLYGYFRGAFGVFAVTYIALLFAWVAVDAGGVFLPLMMACSVAASICGLLVLNARIKEQKIQRPHALWFKLASMVFNRHWRWTTIVSFIVTMLTVFVATYMSETVMNRSVFFLAVASLVLTCFFIYSRSNGQVVEQEWTDRAENRTDTYRFH